MNFSVPDRSWAEFALPRLVHLHRIIDVNGLGDRAVSGVQPSVHSYAIEMGECCGCNPGGKGLLALGGKDSLKVGVGIPGVGGTGGDDAPLAGIDPQKFDWPNLKRDGLLGGVAI